MPCDHPECTDEIHKSYSDTDGNELELCEAHYYWLVSGKKPSTLQPDRTRDFAPARPGTGTLATDRAIGTGDVARKQFSIDRPERRDR